MKKMNRLNLHLLFYIGNDAQVSGVQIIIAISNYLRPTSNNLTYSPQAMMYELYYYMAQISFLCTTNHTTEK